MGKIKYIGCKVFGCEGTHRSKGFCRKHYRVFVCESKKRYRKVKNSPTLTESLRIARERYKKTEAYSKMKATADRRYYDKNKEKLLKYRSELRNRDRFGGLRESILERDNHQCQMCFSKDKLIIHHKDGVGRNTSEPHNDPNNLVTLCRSCHIKVHAFR